MTVLLSDSFTETTNTALTSHTPEVGSTWAIGSGTWTVYEATDSLGTDALDFCWNNVSFSSPDAYTQVTGRTGGTATQDQFGACVRSTAFARNNASANRYYCLVNGLGTVYMSKEVAGVSTQLGTEYTISGFSASTDYLIRLWVDGSSINVDIDGVTRISATDTAVTAAGFSGTHSRNGNSRVTLINAGLLAQPLLSEALSSRKRRPGNSSGPLGRSFYKSPAAYTNTISPINVSLFVKNNILIGGGNV